ncbi:hypothetical protein [Amycolatopsis sp. NPDC021455]|uniref:hypothetical protein n=1 Tax=Amycolatopsis sp. NPDC021455 TaxID=3154901 RepID=UPI0033CC1AA7
MNDQVRAAVEKIFAAAPSRQEAILVTRAVHAVKKGRPTDVPLTAQHGRRELAHVVGCALWDPALDADAVLAAVVDAGRATPRERAAA